eukprot:CAMPEP_0197524916 /NCGR_PEP_ID=MMETSP1318-20131121/10343_1 /TAXON_ID=552666 /ORGANISM="Partenskyella glossopodia, Strain RCC365" /LENGTH=171 /DNA_ID=CAMNT_0043078015 /DNA_START=32 /DNA_END=547 /DNA_ORIENTATION=+
MGEAFSSEEPIDAAKAALIARNVGDFFHHCANKIDGPKEEEEPGKKKRKRKKKDPNAPKRPLGAYFLFLDDNRAKMKKDNPEIKGQAFSKLMGEKWKALDAAERGEYKEKAKKLMEVYESKKNNGTSSSAPAAATSPATPATATKKRKKKKKKRKSEGADGKKKKKKKTST